MAVNRQVIAGRTGELMLPCAASGYRWGGLAAILDSLVSLSMLNQTCVIFYFFAYKEYLLENKSSSSTYALKNMLFYHIVKPHCIALWGNARY